MDNIQPAMLNDATDGKAWVEHIVHLHSILNRNKNTADGSKKLWEYSRDNFIMPNVEKGRLIYDCAAINDFGNIGSLLDFEQPMC